MDRKYESECAHCPGGFGLEYPLFKDKNFWIVCDAHPLIRGHILIITREHISCAGALPARLFSRFAELYKQVKIFIGENYGQPAVFEHGVTGQTVFHAHIHFLPFKNTIDSIIPETDLLKEINSIDQLKTEFEKCGKYLYTEIDNRKWLVDSSLGYPRFFRERFGKTLGVEDRANWKTARDNSELMKIFGKDILDLEEKWKQFAKDKVENICRI